jgi:hypothetical protein
MARFLDIGERVIGIQIVADLDTLIVTWGFSFRTQNSDFARKSHRFERRFYFWGSLSFIPEDVWGKS